MTDLGNEIKAVHEIYLSLLRKQHAMKSKPKADSLSDFFKEMSRRNEEVNRCLRIWGTGSAEEEQFSFVKENSSAPSNVQFSDRRSAA